ncbi:MAG: FoF1 ATP synthase subunit a [Dehalococcoidia bacterium]|nr:FoF1 ATP synthase subunit a [Dehalococcoidia bacterium]
MKPKNILILVGVLVLVFAGMQYPTPKPEISLKAETVGMVMGFPVSNALIATWLTMLVLIFIAWRVTRRLNEVPSGLQNLVEFALEWIFNLCENVAGKNARRFFPLVATIFLFVILNNWMGLLPGYGTIGLVKEASTHAASYVFDTTQVGSLTVGLMPSGKGAEVDPHETLPPGKTTGSFVSFFRGASTTLTTTVALALVAVCLIEYFGISALGFFPYAGRFINVKRLLKGNMMGLIDAFVGVLEGIAEGARIISFGFRLFGNMFAGEVLLFIIPFLIAWFVPVLFYGLELFVGAIQALVFALLTLVFATMAATSHSEGHEAHH